MAIFMMDLLRDPVISHQLPFGKLVYCLILNLIYEDESLVAAGVKYITVNALRRNLAMTIKIWLPTNWNDVYKDLFLYLDKNNSCVRLRLKKDLSLVLIQAEGLM